MLFMVFLCGVGNSSVDGGVLVECVCYVVSGVVVNVVSLIWCVGCVWLCGIVNIGGCVLSLGVLVVVVWIFVDVMLFVSSSVMIVWLW